jgi:hypothetical protein
MISSHGRSKGMAIARGFAATAVFAGLAVGAASTAWADTPTMNGDYIETSKSPTGRTVDTDWAVNPCGEGCVYIKAGAGGSQARLVDGQWVLDTFDTLTCSDGTYVQYAASAHITWDPKTLAGTAQLVYIVPACGRPPGYTQTNQIQLKKAS